MPDEDPELPEQRREEERPTEIEAGGLENVRDLAVVVSESMETARTAIMDDRDEARSAYTMFRDMVSNSADLEVAESARSSMVGALAVAVRADAELVKLAGLAVEVFKAAAKPKQATGSLRRVGASPCDSSDGPQSRREMLEAWNAEERGAQS